MTNNPFFRVSLRSENFQVTTANANLDGATGAYSAAFTAGANGSEIDCVVCQATVATVAGIIRMFYADDGVTFRYIGYVLTKAATPSSTVPADREIFIPDGGMPFPMKAGSKLIFNISNSEAWNINVRGADF